MLLKTIKNFEIMAPHIFFSLKRGWMSCYHCDLNTRFKKGSTPQTHEKHIKRFFGQHENCKGN